MLTLQKKNYAADVQGGKMGDIKEKQEICHTKNGRKC